MGQCADTLREFRFEGKGEQHLLRVSAHTYIQADRGKKGNCTAGVPRS